MIRTLLLLPEAELTAKLLAPNAPGARRRDVDVPWLFGAFNAGSHANPGVFHIEEGYHWIADLTNGWDTFALALARDGARLDEGADRYSRVTGWTRESVDEAIEQLLGGEYPPAMLENMFTDSGTLVLLDEEDNEVALSSLPASHVKRIP